MIGDPSLNATICNNHVELQWKKKKTIFSSPNGKSGAPPGSDNVYGVICTLAAYAQRPWRGRSSLFLSEWPKPLALLSGEGTYTGASWHRSVGLLSILHRTFEAWTGTGSNVPASENDQLDASYRLISRNRHASLTPTEGCVEMEAKRRAKPGTSSIPTRWSPGIRASLPACMSWSYQLWVLLEPCMHASHIGLLVPV